MYLQNSFPFLRIRGGVFVVLYFGVVVGCTVPLLRLDHVIMIVSKCIFPLFILIHPPGLRANKLKKQRRVGRSRPVILSTCFMIRAIKEPLQATAEIIQQIPNAIQDILMQHSSPKVHFGLYISLTFTRLRGAFRRPLSRTSASCQSFYANASGRQQLGQNREMKD